MRQMTTFFIPSITIFVKSNILSEEISLHCTTLHYVDLGWKTVMSSF